MKSLVEFIAENLYKIDDIDVYSVINKVINSKNYPVLKEHFEDEIDDDGIIIQVNGRNTKDNVYTNVDKNSPYQWIVLSNGNKEVALQLLKFDDKDNITLVIAERSKKSQNEHNTFKKILDKVIEKYNPKYIHTFALHDKLKEKYMSYGFKSDKDNELTLEL